MRHGDPTAETAYYLAIGRRGRPQLLLVQGRAVEPSSPMTTIIWGDSTTKQDPERDGPSGRRLPGPSSDAR